MASVPQICNMALSHIGSEAAVSSISPPDGSVEAGLCATFYDLARTEMLEPGTWAFAIKRATIAPATNASTAWLYCYQKPSDCLRPLRVLGAATDDDETSSPFIVEGELIYTDEPEALLVYTRDMTDSTKFTPSFVSALSFQLASYLAGPIVKGNEGAKLADAMRQRAAGLGSISVTATANASQGDFDVTASVTSVRR